MQKDLANVQPLPVKRLEGCATRCHAFNDFNSVEHGPSDPVPLGKHEDVARPQRFDRLVQLGRLTPFRPDSFSLKRDERISVSAPGWQLRLLVTIGGRDVDTDRL
jgi:hypothetical protein